MVKNLRGARHIKNVSSIDLVVKWNDGTESEVKCSSPGKLRFVKAMIRNLRWANVEYQKDGDSKNVLAATIIAKE